MNIKNIEFRYINSIDPETGTIIYTRGKSLLDIHLGNDTIITVQVEEIKGKQIFYSTDWNLANYNLIKLLTEIEILEENYQAINPEKYQQEIEDIMPF